MGRVRDGEIERRSRGEADPREMQGRLLARSLHRHHRDMHPQRLAVESGESSTLGRPEAGYQGRGKPPTCSGGAPGCVGAACAFRQSREAEGAVSSDRVEAILNQLAHRARSGAEVQVRRVTQLLVPGG